MASKPDSFQMQSRFGRYCDQRYQFLLSQDERPAGGSKRRPPTHREKLSAKDLDKLISELEPEDPGKGPKHRKGKSESHVFLVQSRDEFYKAKVTSRQQERAEGPPVGYYHPNFTPVDHSPKVLDFSKNSFARRPIHSARNGPTTSSAQPDSNPLRDTPEPFSKQLARPPFTTLSSPVNEKRFEGLLATPAISTKSKRVVSPDLHKNLSRSYWKFLDSQLYPEYKPDFEYVRPRLARNIDFQKAMGRKYLVRSLSSNPDFQSQEAVSYSQVRPKVRIPDFQKSTSRPATQAGPLPVFMLQTSSRLGLTVPNEKALQMNNYSEAGFFVQHSDFSLRVKQSRGKGVLGLLSPTSSQA